MTTTKPDPGRPSGGAPSEPSDATPRPSATAKPSAIARLSAIPTMKLSSSNRKRLAELEDRMLGSPPWRNRKRVEVHGLLALSELAPRLVVHALEASNDLFVTVELKDIPIPVLGPDETFDPRIARGATLVIRYPEALLSRPIPGPASVRIVKPRWVFHTNVSYGDPVAALCLGANIPRGFPLREIVLTSYAALTLQSISLDAMDPAGVMNPRAAFHFQQHPESIPLTTEPFLGGGAAATPPATGNAEEGRP